MRQALEELRALIDRLLNLFISSLFWLASENSIAYRLYVPALFASLLYFLLSMPVYITDTDQWYHLNGGRYFLEHGEPAFRAFFSFLEPQREWVNYFWGFQAFAYLVFKLAGYQGLIIVKALLVLAAAFLAYRVISNDRPVLTPTRAALIILSLVLIVFTSRSFAFRPHLVSYLFIILFIYVLEHRRSWLFALPPLALVWINFHGVEWPVMALILGAYGFNELTGSRRVPDLWRNALVRVGLVTAAVTLINPYGLSVYSAPFNTPTEIYQFIAELQQRNLSEFFSLSLYNFLIPGRGAIGALFMISLVALLYLHYYRRLRPSDLTLALGAMILLFRGARFLWEWLLLMLPVFSALVSELAQRRHFLVKRVSTILLPIFVISPIYGWLYQSSQYHRYPLDNDRLPAATMEFLKSNQVSGRILTPPGIAGYVQWALYPDMLIHSDMEFPPFNGLDFYETAAAYRDKQGLATFIDRHHPDVITTYLKNSKFKEIIGEREDYAPVYFDNSLVTYIERNRYPDLVARFELKKVNPFSPLDFDDKTSELKAMREEIDRLLQYGNEDRVLLTTAAKLGIESKDFVKAGKHAAQLKVLFPEDPNGYLLSGYAQENTERCAEAIENFSSAGALVASTDKRNIEKHIARCHYQLKQFFQAYEHFRLGFNAYYFQEEYEDFYQYAFSSIVAGDFDRATRLLKMMEYLDATEKAAIAENAAKLRTKLEQNKIVGNDFKGWISSLFGGNQDR